MSGIRKYLLLSAIVILWACPQMRGQNVADVAGGLQFEESSTPISWPGGTVPVGGQRPTYAAVLVLRSSPPKAPPNESIVQDYFMGLAQSGRVDFSPEQLSFWRTVVPGLSVRVVHATPAAGVRLGDANDYTIVLYAASAEDARRVSQAYVYLIQDQHSAAIRHLQKAVQDTSRRTAADQNELSQLGGPLSEAGRTYKSLQQEVLYTGVDEAFACIIELDQSFNASQIEIAGIRARIDAIQGYQKGQQASPPDDTRLNAMLTEESIALRAAEARKLAAADLRRQTQEYIDAHWMAESTVGQVGQLSTSLPDRRSKLQDLRRQLAAAQNQKFIILDNKVTIRPVVTR
jgi:hypothetical protein